MKAVTNSKHLTVKRAVNQSPNLLLQDPKADWCALAVEEGFEPSWPVRTALLSREAQLANSVTLLYAILEGVEPSLTARQAVVRAGTL